MFFKLRIQIEAYTKFFGIQNQIMTFKRRLSAINYPLTTKNADNILLFYYYYHYYYASLIKNLLSLLNSTFLVQIPNFLKAISSFMQGKRLQQRQVSLSRQ
jgi:hypothetical protein